VRRQLAAAYPQTDAGRLALLTATTIVPPDAQSWVRPMLGAVVGVSLAMPAGAINACGANCFVDGTTGNE